MVQFRKKIFYEFEDISIRIFSEKRIQRLVQCIFRSPNISQYKWEYEHIVCRLKIATILLEGLSTKFSKSIDPNYRGFVLKDLNNAHETLESFLRILENNVKPVRIE